MKLAPTAIEHLQSEWAGVVKMQKRMKTLVVVTFAGGALTAPALRKVLYNLPLLLAFDVLKQTLARANEQYAFLSSRRRQPTLGALMEAAKERLTWCDWSGLRDGVERRNEVAHDGKLFDGEQCLSDIANVERQLVAWGLIDGKTDGDGLEAGAGGQ